MDGRRSMCRHGYDERSCCPGVTLCDAGTGRWQDDGLWRGGRRPCSVFGGDTAPHAPTACRRAAVPPSPWFPPTCLQNRSKPL